MNPADIKILGNIGDESINTANAALEASARLLVNDNLVKNTFTQAILDREKTFPTGLAFTTYGIAIPHTDPTHVKSQAILVNLLSKPVDFHHMASPDQVIAVDMLIMLAIKDKEFQLPYLSALIKLFQDEAKAKILLASRSKIELTSNFKKFLKEKIK